MPARAPESQSSMLRDGGYEFISSYATSLATLATARGSHTEDGHRLSDVKILTQCTCPPQPNYIPPQRFALSKTHLTSPPPSTYLAWQEVTNPRYLPKLPPALSPLPSLPV